MSRIQAYVVSLAHMKRCASRMLGEDLEERGRPTETERQRQRDRQTQRETETERQRRDTDRCRTREIHKQHPTIQSFFITSTN